MKILNATVNKNSGYMLNKKMQQTGRKPVFLFENSINFNGKRNEDRDVFKIAQKKSQTDTDFDLPDESVDEYRQHFLNILNNDSETAGILPFIKSCLRNKKSIFLQSYCYGIDTYIREYANNAQIHSLDFDLPLFSEAYSLKNTYELLKKSYSAKRAKAILNDKDAREKIKIFNSIINAMIAKILISGFKNDYSLFIRSISTDETPKLINEADYGSAGMFKKYAIDDQRKLYIYFDGNKRPRKYIETNFDYSNPALTEYGLSNKFKIIVRTMDIDCRGNIENYSVFDNDTGNIELSIDFLNDNTARIKSYNEGGEKISDKMFEYSNGKFNEI